MLLFPLTPITATKDRKKRTTRHAPYAVSRGPGPANMACGTCAFLRVNEMRSGKRFFKCGWVTITHGPGTDIRKKDPACSKYEHGPGRQIYPAHPHQRHKGLAMLTIKDDGSDR